LIEDAPITINNDKVEALIGHIKFFSATYRLFKIEDLEPACEDYGQAVIYQGTVTDSPNEFKLDGHHIIQKGKVFPVCGNTFMMLEKSRFAPHFKFIGDMSNHFGIFAGCGTNLPFADVDKKENKASCC
jgi:arsenite methyltransferase